MDEWRHITQTHKYTQSLLGEEKKNKDKQESWSDFSEKPDSFKKKL